ncbi:alkaline phosphatase family protein [Algoriphagus sp. PAP.12]|uniref:alkaline phosphatase family protein n=1 Tax=Algoriphagus sp. PAP.12 TaxID=2996678 RepID=UPI00227BEC4C|nr:ectonucleotide pyrophosphatase/phosphodiesterase [Algoriphagus sp. PAP.12]
MRPVLAFLLVFMGLLPHSFAQEEDQYVILISLDGFRYDYVERFQPPNISRFIENGTAAEGLIPSFPSKTFPNHYTIVTGMKPEHHGIVDNNFYHPQKGLQYSISNREIITDGSWYGGTPIWVLAEQNEITSASYYFVGSEADVQGIHPTYYFDYDGSVPNLTRVSQVFDWLQLPENERPKLITMYFSDMDDTGHRFGPNNDEELKKTLYRLDHELGALFEGVKSLDLPINIVLVSDHGMADVPSENLLNYEPLLEGVKARAVNSGTLLHLHLEDVSQKESIKSLIESRGEHIHVIDVDDREYYKDLALHKDLMGDLLIIPDLGYNLVNERSLFRARNMTALDKNSVSGAHGYSPDYKEMQGIFYANGPRIKENYKIEAFENIHIYPLLCELLGLPIPSNIDGKEEVLKSVLK